MTLTPSFPPKLDDLIFRLSKLPGIGPKSAARIAFYLLEIEEDKAIALASAISEFRLKTHPCTRCGFPIQEANCVYCDDPKRDSQKICIIEKSQDILSIEKSHAYHGHYHTLGGVISPLEGIEINDLRFAELINRIEKGDFKEALFALSPNMEGEATSLFLGEKLKKHGLRTLRLSMGLPMGSELEFVDSLTLSRAISSCVEI